MKSDSSFEKRTTIKVRSNFRRWLKIEATKRDVPMYQLVEEAMSVMIGGGTPWEQPEPCSKDS